MGCGCKTNNGGNNTPTSINDDKLFIEGFSPESKLKHKTKTPLRYTINFLVFLISLVLLPVMMLGVVALMFQVLVLNDTLDMGKIARIVAHKIKFANYDEDDLRMIYGDEETEEETDELEYVNLYEIEDIKEGKTNVE